MPKMRNRSDSRNAESSPAVQTRSEVLVCLVDEMPEVQHVLYAARSVSSLQQRAERSFMNATRFINKVRAEEMLNERSRVMLGRPEEGDVKPVEVNSAAPLKPRFTKAELKRAKRKYR